MIRKTDDAKEIARRIFDLEWYKIATGVNFNNLGEAMLHYRSSDAEHRCSCSPYLDENFYLSVNKDVKDEGLSALDHYVIFGDKELRNPSPLISTAFYKNKYRVSRNALIDFIERGDRPGVQTSAVFMSAWYSKKNHGTSEPLLHYVLHGNDSSYTPNPAFDAMFVRAALNVPREENIYTAYAIASATREISFNYIFDVEFFKNRLGSNDGFEHLRNPNLLEKFLLSPIHADPNPLFSRKFYRDKYMQESELNEFADFLSDERQYKDPHPLFSTKYYYGRRPDVWNAGQNALLHFLTIGFTEKSDPHPFFSCEEYYEANPDLHKTINPLLHYVQHGKSEHRKLRKSAPIIDIARRIQHYAKYAATNRPSKPFDGRIGVFAHIYYTELSQEIVNYTNNTPKGTKIFISTTSHEKAYDINMVFSRYSSHDFVIKVVENRGRDIAPMLISFKRELVEVDLALHIHTKKSKHYENGFDEWRKYLLDQLCGSPDRASQIIDVFSDDNIGAVAPLDFPAIEKLINWGGNQNAINKLMNLVSNGEFGINSHNKLELPSGSMFWFRTKAIEPLIKLDLPIEIFDPEDGQIDGTLAHALERAFFYIIEFAGYGCLRFKATSRNFECPAFLHGRLLPVHSGTRPTVASNPEIRYFTAGRSDNPKPRLNLLIPTAERSLGYAGISEALRLFHGVRSNLRNNFDLRIIGTDVPFSANISIDHDAVIEDMEEDNPISNYSVVDGTLKNHRILAVRQNDVFVATAWWTAIQAKNLIAQQRSIYDSSPEKFVYLIQDYECGFYPWSTRYAYAESTYKELNNTITVFNTNILADFFDKNGYKHAGIIYNPPINEKIACALAPNTQREKTVLIYMRRAALRNCLEFADAVVYEAIKNNPIFWRDWKFIAIGEEFDPKSFTRSGIIEGGQRLSLTDYASTLSKAAIGLSFMVSPHPSYPPLEMAAAGMKVITNTYANKDLGTLHENIASFDLFDERAVAAQLQKCADNLVRNNMISAPGEAYCDWFFDGKTNAEYVYARCAEEITAMTSLMSRLKLN